jgi:fructokinase
MRNHGATPQQHLRFAVASGAAACLSPGASPPSLAQVKALYEQSGDPQ